MSIDNKEGLKTDVVVIGGGAAGLCAAVAAAENGASVILLEKRSEVGGNAAIYGKEIPAVESPVQKRELVDLSRDALFRKAMKNCRWDCDPRVVRAIVDKSGDTIGWLQEKGLQFKIICIHPDEDMVVFHKVLSESGGELGGQLLVNALVKRGKELGVNILCEMEPKKILTGASGEVTGVQAVNNAGEEITAGA